MLLIFLAALSVSRTNVVSPLRYFDSLFVLRYFGFKSRVSGPEVLLCKDWANRACSKGQSCTQQGEKEAGSACCSGPVGSSGRERRFNERMKLQLFCKSKWASLRI